MFLWSPKRVRVKAGQARINMDYFDYKHVLAFVATGMTIWAHIPYFMDTLKGTNKPHIFTWVIWTILTFIAAAAQISGGAGAGALVTFVTGLICLAITIAAFQKGEKNITRSDWVMFVFGLGSIPVWIMTSDPLMAVIIVTLIDVSAVVPTFRKSWHKPFEENTFMYGFNLPRHMCAIASLQTFSFVTALYPAALLLMNAVMYAMLKCRRMNIKKLLN